MLPDTARINPPPPDSKRAIVRDRQLADLVRDLDQAFELLDDTQPDQSGDYILLSIRESDSLLAVLERAADFLQELRDERLRTTVPARALSAQPSPRVDTEQPR